MGKHDMPAFQMIVENGRLVPATTYDQERLLTWRNGSPVNVTFARNGSRVMEKKWFAVLNRAVKECPTPWKTSAEASEAVKLAIGVVNLTKTVGGEFMAYPKSLTELSDPELDEAVLQMLDVIHHVTGVDPDEWKKQTDHIRDDESSSVPPPADDVGSEGAAPSVPAAEPSPSQERGASEAGSIKAPDGQDALPASTLSDEDREWLNLAAKMLWRSIGRGEEETVRGSWRAIREHQTPKTISVAAWNRGLSVKEKCLKACEFAKIPDETLPEIAMAACCETREIVS